ncbi:heterokaryon incompatibility protein-domain-containing protein [Xylaria digitata]|nr:heterokaryon incompatibility protein-domain-containing protein [Xylaria digitata]
MDYNGLEINGCQIRLITITPPRPGENRETDTIRCTLEPRSESNEPTSQEYVNFDDCVTEPPLELLVEQIRWMMGPLEAQMKGQSLAKRAMLKVRSKILRRDVDPTIRIPVEGIPELLSPDERHTTMLAQAPDLHRRLQSQIGIFEVFEDATGASIVATDPPKTNYHYVGEMYWKHLNPFCQPRHPRSTEKYMLEWVKNRDRYIALSYPWANLESALRQLRNMTYFKSLGKIWIDSLFWVGPTADESDLVISYLEYAGAGYRSEYVEAFDMGDPITATTWRSMGQIRLKTSYDQFRKWHIEGIRTISPLLTQWRRIRNGVLRCMAIFDLLNDKTRDVIGQLPEVTMTREHSLIHVAQIAQLEIAGHRRELPHVDQSHLPLLAPTLYEHGPLLGSVIRRAVTLALQSECSIGKDRIYGMLNIPGLPQMNIEVDYTKSLGAIFTEFTKACIEHGSLDFFAAIDGEDLTWVNEQRKIHREAKPSWVPDYGVVPARRIGVIEGDWYAGGRVPTSWSQARIYEGNRLYCAGKVVDTVNGVGAVSKADLEINVIPDDLVFPIVQQPKIQTAPSEGDPNIHEVLMGGCDINGLKLAANSKCLYEAFPAEEPSMNSSYYRNWHFLNSSANLLIQGRPLSSYFTPFTDLPSTAPTHSPSQVTPLSEPTNLASVSVPQPSTQPSTPIERKIESAASRQAMEARTKMRRLIVTESLGLLGIAPMKTQPGDAVIIVAGHSKPLIAREMGTPAYIDGMMQSKLPLSDKTWNSAETRAVKLDTIAFV